MTTVPGVRGRLRRPPLRRLRLPPPHASHFLRGLNWLCWGREINSFCPGPLSRSHPGPSAPPLSSQVRLCPIRRSLTAPSAPALCWLCLFACGRPAPGCGALVCNLGCVRACPGEAMETPGPRPPGVCPRPGQGPGMHACGRAPGRLCCSSPRPTVSGGGGGPVVCAFGLFSRRWAAPECPRITCPAWPL